LEYKLALHIFISITGLPRNIKKKKLKKSSEMAPQNLGLVKPQPAWEIFWRIRHAPG